MLGLAGLVLSCLFWPFGSVLCIIALVMIWQYNHQREQAPNVPPHPSDADRIRTGQVTAVIGLVLTVILCGFVTFLYGVGLFVTVTATPTPLP
jgi:uncharacterized membrane protein YfcA